jgi:hypothetical protein
MCARFALKNVYFISRHIHAYKNRCLVSVFICQFAAPRKMYIIYYAKKLLLAHGTYPETFETKLKLNNFKSHIIYNYNQTQKHLRNKIGVKRIYDVRT